MAIIDILTPYDAKKKAAHAAKTVKHGVSSPYLRPDPVGGPSDPQGGWSLAYCLKETFSRPLSQSREQEEQPACLLGVLSLPSTPHPGVIRPTCFSLCSLALRILSLLASFPRAAGHIVHLVDLQ